MTTATLSADPSGMPTLNGVPIFPVFGGTQPSQYGIVSGGDALVNQLADGTNLNDIWADFGAAMEIWNGHRRTIASLLSFQTTAAGEAVPQSMSVPSFEETTEYGVTKAAGTPADAMILGYTFKDFGLRTAFTWKFLRNADRRSVNGIFDALLAADNKLTTGTILRRLFDPAQKRNEFGHAVYGLWNGTDGLAPPPHMGREFSSAESHYIASSANLIDSDDIESAFGLITRKGYGTRESGGQLVILANPTEAIRIASWRAGMESRPSSGILASYDFIPSVSAPPYLTQDTIVGQPAPADYQGLPVSGSYGPAFLIESNWIPSGYVIVASTHGMNHPFNAVGFREHPNDSYRGLLMLPGNGPYPVVDSHHLRSFGVGVRHRGAAVCIQVTTNPSYTKPADNLIPV